MKKRENSYFAGFDLTGKGSRLSQCRFALGTFGSERIDGLQPNQQRMVCWTLRRLEGNWTGDVCIGSKRPVRGSTALTVWKCLACQWAYWIRKETWQKFRWKDSLNESSRAGSTKGRRHMHLGGLPSQRLGLWFLCRLSTSLFWKRGCDGEGLSPASEWESVLCTGLTQYWNSILYSGSGPSFPRFPLTSWQSTNSIGTWSWYAGFAVKSNTEVNERVN
jgi:hypothetical protein